MVHYIELKMKKKGLEDEMGLDIGNIEQEIDELICRFTHRDRTPIYDYHHISLYSWHDRENILYLGIKIFHKTNPTMHSSVISMTIYYQSEYEYYDAYVADRIITLLSMKYKIEPAIRKDIFYYGKCMYCNNPILNTEHADCDFCREQKEQLKKDTEITGIVYFIQDGFGGNYIKIGWAKNIENRMHDFNHLHASHQKVLLTIPGNLKMEKSLHREYSKQYYGNEWFYYKGELRDYIDSNKGKQNFDNILL